LFITSFLANVVGIARIRQYGKGHKVPGDEIDMLDREITGDAPVGMEDAVEAAMSGKVTWVTQGGRRIAAIVPVEVAVAAIGQPGPVAVCGACKDSRHEDCAQYYSGAGDCGCDQRTLHGRIMADKVAMARLARRYR
jgi:hypothetical protein